MHRVFPGVVLLVVTIPTKVQRIERVHKRVNIPHFPYQSEASLDQTFGIGGFLHTSCPTDNLDTLKKRGFRHIRFQNLQDNDRKGSVTSPCTEKVS